MNRRTQGLSIPVIVAAAVCGVVMGTLGLLPRPIVRWSIPLAEANAFISDARLDAGEELMLVVVGSSTCRWSSTDDFVELVAEVRTAIRQVADQNGTALAIMGVSLDERPDDGVKYLGRFGGMDEMSVGRGWRNTAIGKYIFGSFPGRAATPQLLVIARTLTQHGGQWGFANERVLARKIGLLETRNWLAGGAPLSKLTRD